jgi:putative transcriptional regulator
MRGSAALAALLLACAARAQPDAIVLVARPEMVDANFSGAVVLVTHTPTGDTVGVILNRPTRLKLADVAPEFPHAAAYKERLYDGGPVLRQVIVALFHSSSPPEAPAFAVLGDLYLSMHPDNIGRLLERPDGRARLFTGFAGWAPGQLEMEIARESWYALPASEDLLFRADTSSLWRELVDRARSKRAVRGRSAGYT